MAKRGGVVVVGKTVRGFALMTFVDRDGEPCSLQRSSVATEDLIRFGTDNEKARMHLTPEMVAALLPALKRFAKKGRLPCEEED
jgi:hypothetical protein